MTQRRGYSESPAMRSSGAATGIPSRMPASSISTTTGPTTATTMSASADPRNNRLDVGIPDGRTTLGRESPGATAPKARQHAQPETAALPTGGTVECGKNILSRIHCFFTWHDWTCAAAQGIKPTQKQLDDGVDGFFDYATMYCARCGYVYKPRSK